MISEAILITKIGLYARLQKIASNFSKFSGEGPQTPAGARAFGARFGASPTYLPPFPKFLDQQLSLIIASWSWFGHMAVSRKRMGKKRKEENPWT